jgi:hypothetical protein
VKLRMEVLEDFDIKDKNYDEEEKTMEGILKKSVVKDFSIEDG